MKFLLSACLLVAFVTFSFAEPGIPNCDSTKLGLAISNIGLNESCSLDQPVQEACAKCGTKFKALADAVATDCHPYTLNYLFSAGYDSKLSKYCTEIISSPSAAALLTTYTDAVTLASQNQSYGTLPTYSGSCDGASYCLILYGQFIIESNPNSTVAIGKQWASDVTKAVSSCGLSANDVTICGIRNPTPSPSPSAAKNMAITFGGPFIASLAAYVVFIARGFIA